MGLLWAVVGFVITISIVVVIHEGGHYLAAKWLGFDVKRFSVGMGKVLWRRRAWNTEFALSALPVGGYVMFEEDDPTLGAEARAKRFDAGSRLKRAVVVAAGPFMNFVLAVILFAAAGALGVQDVAPIVGARADTQASAAGIAALDRVTGVEGARVDGITDFNMALAAHLGEKDVAVTFERGNPESGETPEVFERRFDLSAITMDAVSKNQGFVFPMLGFTLEGRGVLVASVADGSPAQAAGLKPAMLILSMNGETADMTRFSQVIRESAGKAVELVVKDLAHDGASQTIILTPRAETLDNGETVGRIGLVYRPSIELATVRHGPIESIKLAFDKVVRLTEFQATTVKGMAEGSVSTENLSGPVGIVDMAGDAMAAGISPFLEYIALISVAIGFMNLIPIPALDGGQLVLLGIEGAMRRPLPPGVKEKLGALSFAVLLLLVFYVTMNDVTRIAGGS